MSVQFNIMPGLCSLNPGLEKSALLELMTLHLRDYCCCLLSPKETCLFLQRAGVNA